MKRKFLVVTHIKHDKADYQPGELIDLTPEEAAEMPWAVKAILPARKPAPSKEAVE
jgi:hypothetical protein